MNQDRLKPATQLRNRLKLYLEENDFQVVLGEDDGLEKLRRKYNGLADDNELSFVIQHAGAVVVVADSAGSFCELGLFSHMCFPARAQTNYLGDLILIANRNYQNDDSYFNNGPAMSVETLGGKVFYADFQTFNPQPIIERLNIRRTVSLNRNFTDFPS
jgi:hypothetical protein